MTEKRPHTSDCDWHVDQYPWECTCGAIPRKEIMDELIEQDSDLITRLLDDELLTLQTLRDAAARLMELNQENQELRSEIDRMNNDVIYL